jgi:hypothetical protein
MEIVEAVPEPRIEPLRGILREQRPRARMMLLEIFDDDCRLGDGPVPGLVAQDRDLGDGQRSRTRALSAASMRSTIRGSKAVPLSWSAISTFWQKDASGWR